MRTFLVLIICLWAVNTFAQKPSGEYFTVESYYKVKWGHDEEFLDLYKKNHLPLLKKALERGDIVSIKMEKPRLHDSEETRWDYRVTIVFKNAQAAYDPQLTEPYKKTLYPDLDKLKREEQHRFEILLAHWDVELTNIDIEAR